MHFYRNFKKKMLLPFVFILITTVVSNGQQLEFWLTDPDANILFQQQPSISPNIDNYVANDVIIINDSATYQTIDGFGYALTGGSALHLHNLNDTVRAQTLQELFNTDKSNIGVSYLRISIGSSDLDAAPFSYDDLPAGETDRSMSHFDLGNARLHVIPILKEILAINPNIKILGSPWSPPPWMKSNKSTIGGTLIPDYYDPYALYFVRFIQEMQKEGITIDAITVQNEPMNPNNNPSLYMDAASEGTFVKKSLGPMFRQASIKTKIIIWDHNCDMPNYPISILQDADARQYIDGSAFHLYGGDISALSTVHDQFPDKNLYFTEQWVGAPGHLKGDLTWHVKNLIIGATRNWARNVIEWNLANNPALEPHTPGGCSQCLGALTIDGNNVLYPRNPSYYVIAHAAKFVRPTSIRIGSNMLSGLPNVAFQRPNDQKKVLIVLNENDSGKQTFQIQCNGKTYDSSLNGGSVGTYIC
jgi:glucosylceramidase